MMGTVAMAQELIPGGKALGIKMLTDGVMVAGVQSCLLYTSPSPRDA